MYKNDSAFSKCQKVDGHLVLIVYLGLSSLMAQI